MHTFNTCNSKSYFDVILGSVVESKEVKTETTLTGVCIYPPATKQINNKINLSASRFFHPPQCYLTKSQVVLRWRDGCMKYSVQLFTLFHFHLYKA